jgi:hypothetical protein
VTLCHPLPYGRRAAPSKKDGGALKGKTNNYATSVQGQRCDVGPAGPVTSVAIGPVRPSPPPPTPSRPLQRHCNSAVGTAAPSPTLLRCTGTRHRHALYCASYGLLSAAPSSQHAGSGRMRNLHTTTLEAATVQAQDSPRRPNRSKIHRDSHQLRGTTRRASTRRKIVWHACKLLSPWPIKGGAVPQPPGDRDTETDDAHSHAFRLHPDICTCLNQYLWDLEG